MKGLFLTMPPLAPDYSGVCSVFFEFDAMIVHHDGGGCVGNYLGHDELRTRYFQHMVYTTNLRELEIVMGNDDAYLEKVTRAEADVDPKMMVLLGSPAPMVIGTDFKALAKIMEKRTGKKTFYYDTNGIRFYDQGQKRAYLDLVKAFSSANTPYHGICVLGATPLSIGMSQNADALRNLITEAIGLPTLVLGMGDREEALEQIGNAKLNLVISPSAIPAAKWCEETYGTPWITACPVGKSGIRNLKERIEKALSGESIRKATVVKSAMHQEMSSQRGCRALVIHEQIVANGFREFLKEEIGIESVNVASFFEMVPDLEEDGDFTLYEEDDFIEKVKDGNYDVVLCDKILAHTLKEVAVKVISLPHLALSGVDCYQKEFSAIGIEAGDWVRTQIESHEHESNGVRNKNDSVKV